MGRLLLPILFMALDIVSAGAALFCSVGLRFEGKIPEQHLVLMAQHLPIFILLVIVFLVLFRLYNRVWLYAGSDELISIIAASVGSTITHYIYSSLTNSLLLRSTYIVTAVLLCFFIGTSRMGLRIYKYLKVRLRFVARFSNNLSAEKILVIGAGGSGVEFVKKLLRHNKLQNLVGFIDDDKKKVGKEIQGAKVLGGCSSLKKYIIKFGVKVVVITTAAIKGEVLTNILEVCKQTDCEVKILPGISGLPDDVININQLRDVKIEDLLGRPSVKLDTDKIAAFLKDKVILVTGAGGSIGSEICRQIAAMQPQRLLLLGKGENSIYEISQELGSLYPELDKVAIIADVRDRDRIKDIMDRFRPQVVFHAAAHKHVPLMEYQAIEAVKNNVFGTKTVAEEAALHDVETFVMISTDKAVNPTSVMGCTKRIAEMFVQSMNNCSRTRFVAVRFGNVLGSRGSVIPLFKKQIAQGGPVTVTHPDMKRYFMTIPEASQLVLQAGAMAKGGEVFVLDMGEPIKICDLAKMMIFLSGLVPDKDIKIKYTGLRPGEKLFEELLSAEDGTEETCHEKIFTAKLREISKKQMDQWLRLLEMQTAEADIVKVLQEIVPTYKNDKSVIRETSDKSELKITINA